MTETNAGLNENTGLDFATLVPEMPAPEPAPPGFGLRLAAKIVDMLVLLFLQWGLFWATAFLQSTLISGVSVLVCLLAGSVLQFVIYYAFFNSGGRRTPGYWLAGLQAVTLEGAPLTIWRGLARSIVMSLFACTPVWYFDGLRVAWSKDKRTWHDSVTKTRVIRTRAPKQPGLALGVAAMFLAWPLAVSGGLGMRAFYVPSGAMEPSVQVGDKMFANLIALRLREPAFGKIVIFKAPDASGSGGADFVKRCIGTPGHVIEIRKGKLFRDGKPVAEPYVKRIQPPDGYTYGYDMKIVRGQIYSRDYMVSPDMPDAWRTAGAAPQMAALDQDGVSRAPAEPVPAGQVVMLGDNRNNSNDSHLWGFAPQEKLFGLGMAIYWPFNHLKSL